MTTTDSIKIQQFEDPDLQRLFEQLRLAASREGKLKAATLRGISDQAKNLATKIDPAAPATGTATDVPSGVSPQAAAPTNKSAAIARVR
jgi:hypothetical protein